MDSQVTPCYIPLRELAFTEFIQTFTQHPTPSNASSEHAVANTTTEQGVNETQPPEDNEALGITSDVPSADTTNVFDSEITNDEPSGTVTYETPVSPHVEPTEDVDRPTPAEPATSDGGNESAVTSVNVTRAATAAMPTYSAEITLCIPCCAALDEHDRCVVIKGCGYPEGGNFGRHGCCPPGFYSSLEVLGLVTFATMVVIFVWCLRG